MESSEHFLFFGIFLFIFLSSVGFLFLLVAILGICCVALMVGCATHAEYMHTKNVFIREVAAMSTVLNIFIKRKNVACYRHFKTCFFFLLSLHFNCLFYFISAHFICSSFHLLFLFTNSS